MPLRLHLLCTLAGALLLPLAPIQGGAMHPASPSIVVASITCEATQAERFALWAAENKALLPLLEEAGIITKTAAGGAAAGELAAEASKVAQSTADIAIKFHANSGHLVKRASLLGYDVSPQAAQKIIPKLQQAVINLVKRADPALTRVGRWHSFENAIMYISDGKMIVTQADGTFITIIGKTSNNWYQQATILTTL